MTITRNKIPLIGKTLLNRNNNFDISVYIPRIHINLLLRAEWIIILRLNDGVEYFGGHFTLINHFSV